MSEQHHVTMEKRKAKDDKARMNKKARKMEAVTNRQRRKRGRDVEADIKSGRRTKKERLLNIPIVAHSLFFHPC